MKTIASAHPYADVPPSRPISVSDSHLLPRESATICPPSFHLEGKPSPSGLRSVKASRHSNSAILGLRIPSVWIDRRMRKNNSECVAWSIGSVPDIYTQRFLVCRFLVCGLIVGRENSNEVSKVSTSRFESLRTDYGSPAGKAKEVAKDAKEAAKDAVGAIVPVSARVGIDAHEVAWVAPLQVSAIDLRGSWLAESPKCRVCAPAQVRSFLARTLRAALRCHFAGLSPQVLFLQGEHSSNTTCLTHVLLKGC